MKFPGEHLINDPILDLKYQMDIAATAGKIWPWLKQMGYHRAGWYIDTWWDRFEQKYFWPAVVPPEARGTYQPAAKEILAKYQDISIGDIIPDGPPDSAYYEVRNVIENQLLLLYATTHFNYMAPRFVYQTRFAPKGAFCWAFIIHQIDENHCQLTSWWQAEGSPKVVFTIMKPLLFLVDRAHQREILRGIKNRVENTLA